MNNDSFRGRSGGSLPHTMQHVGLPLARDVMYMLMLKFVEYVTIILLTVTMLSTIIFILSCSFVGH